MLPGTLRPRPVAFPVLSGEVEKDSFSSLAHQAAVDTVRQVLEHVAHVAIQESFQILEQELAADQFDKLFLLFDHFAIFLLDTAQGVEVLGMDNLSENAGIQEAAAVNAGDLLGEAFD